MSGTTYYAVSLLETHHPDDEESILVFDDRVQALKLCKKFKGARFKCFSDRNDAIAFAKSKQSVVQEVDTSKDVPSEKLPYPTPSPQEMLELRKAIETGNLSQFQEMIWKNPRFLVGAGDTPTMVRDRYRYHSLLLAAFKQKYQICKAILDTITDPSFIQLLYSTDTEEVRSNRIFYLLDTYLNTPDKFQNETALHFAAKYGCVDIVELLVSYPECDRERRNTQGLSPIDVTCSSCRNPTPEIESQIRTLLSQRFFVPVLRPTDLTSPGVVGKPWSPDVSSRSPNISEIQRRYPVDPNIMLHALAGPMSPTEAESFYKKMKTPPITKLHQSPAASGTNNLIESRLSDIEKGIERMGRDIAKDLNIPWSEYWGFLDEFCDFSSDDGLEKLEEYFRNCRNSVEETRPVREESSPEKSPLSDLCSKMSHMRLQSPKDNNNDEVFFTPPSSPLSTFFDISPFFILGPQPSKVDVDVYRVLRPIEIDFKKYPNVCMWKENMSHQTIDQLTRVRTPLANHSSVKSPATGSPVASPRISSLAKCLYSPRRNRLPVARLSQRFDNDE